MHTSRAFEDQITTTDSDIELPSLGKPGSTLTSAVSVPDIPHNDLACRKASPLYSPLRPGSREIRVLDVGPPDNTNDFALCGRLRVVDLNDNPKFTALSYVWGTYSLQRHTVSCGSSSIEVTTNCHSALYHLRKLFNPLTIWVDSICINQKDEEEKMSQIPLMGDIYPMAESVYIWLGEGSPDSDQAMDYLSNAGFQDFLVPHGKFNYLIPEKSAVLWEAAFYRAYVRHIRGFKAYMGRNGRYLGMDSLIMVIKSLTALGRKGLSKAIFITTLALIGLPVEPHGGQAPYTAVANFLLKEWNDRIWTLQEVLLATNPIVCCGTKSVAWRCFIHSIAYLEQAKNWQLFFTKMQRENTCNKWRSIVSLWLAINSELQTWKQDEESIGQYAAKLSISASTGVHRDLEGYFAFLQSTRRKYKKILGAHCILAVVPLAGIGPLCKFVVLGWVYTIIVIISFVCVLAAWALFTSINSTYSSQYFRQEVEIPQNIIDEILMRKTTDPRDKSHGMRAVLSKLGVDLPAPDSFTNQNEIYRDLFIDLTKWTSSLRLLVFTSGEVDENKPSWVPDFHRVSNIWLKEYFLHRRVRATRKKARSFRQIPVGPLSFKAQLSFANHNQELLVRGYTIGEVEWRGDEFRETEGMYDEADTALHLQNIRPVCEPWYQYKRKTGFSPGIQLTVSSQLLNELQALCVDKDITFPASERNLSKWWYTINQWKGPGSSAEDFLKELCARPSMLQLHVNLCNNLAFKNRCFFHTLGPPVGSVIFGNGPGALEVGDTIAVVEGVPVPLVIRRESERESYRLIGFAEFGWEPMDTSTWNDIELRGRKWEEIVLR